MHLSFAPGVGACYWVHMDKTKEVFVRLAEKVGVREAGRQMKLSENTAKSWWRRREGKVVVEGQEEGEKDSRLPWPYNVGKAPRWGAGVEEYVPMTLEEREAVEGMDRRAIVRERPEGCSEAEWELCKVRAHRAVRYAEEFPEHVRPSEEVFSDPIWQWENEVKRGRVGIELRTRDV